MSEETDGKVLDLDQLFGQAKAVKVKWEGEMHELLRLEAISPKQAMKFNQLYLRAGKLQQALQSKTGDELSDADVDEVQAVFDEMLGMLCATLPLKEIPYMAKSQIMVFYMEQTQGKKAMEAALSQVTGGRRSRG